MANKIIFPVTATETKTCKKCHEVKPLFEFHNYKNERGEPCKRGACGKCVYEDVRAWRIANPEKYKDLNKRIGARVRSDKRRSRDRRLKNKFGMSIEDYEKQFGAQGGVCKICKNTERALTPAGVPRNLAVDHHHESGQVRGLLCHSCNFLLGRIENVGIVEFANYLGDKSNWLPFRASPYILNGEKRQWET